MALKDGLLTVIPDLFAGCVEGRIFRIRCPWESVDVCHVRFQTPWSFEKELTGWNITATRVSKDEEKEPDSQHTMLRQDNCSRTRSLPHLYNDVSGSGCMSGCQSHYHDSSHISSDPKNFLPSSRA
jgi:hypothetical protein